VAVDLLRRTRRAQRTGSGQGQRDTLASLAMREAMESLYIDHNRMLFGAGPRTVRQRCPNCGERQCENAPVKEYPAAQDYDPDFSWSTFTLNVEPGSVAG
jgi:hypothetical protein